MPKIAPPIQEIREPIFSVESELVEATVSNRNKYLAFFAGLAIGCPFVAAWVPMPMNFRATLVVGSVMSSASFVWAEETTRKAKKYAAKFNKAQELEINNRLKLQVFTNNLLQQAAQTDLLLSHVQQMPENMREYWLEQWRLKNVIREPRAALPAAMATVTVENRLSPGVINQPTLSVEREAELEQQLDITWFAEWTSRSGAVCGETHDGKTFLLKYVQLDFMAKNPEGTIIIVDLDYGSSHGDEPGNLWANAEEGKVVFTDVDSAFYAVKRVSDEVDKRAKITIAEQKKGNAKPKFDPWLLIIDEGLLVWAKLDIKQREQYINYISNILTRGLKQGNITFKFGAQSLAVGKIGLDQMILNSIEIVLLYRAAQTKVNYRNIRDGGDEQELESIITTVKNFPEKIGRLRLAVGYTGKKFKLIGVPHITFTEPAALESSNGDFEKNLWDSEFQDKYGDDPDTIIDIESIITEDTIKDGDDTGSVTPGNTADEKPDYLRIHEMIMDELTAYDGVMTDEVIKGVYEKITGQKITKDLVNYIRETLRRE